MRCVQQDHESYIMTYGVVYSNAVGVRRDWRELAAVRAAKGWRPAV